MLASIAGTPVGGVKLYTRFRGIHLKSAARSGLHDPDGKAQLAWLALVEHKAVVISRSVLQLLLRQIDALTHDMGRRKVKGRPLDTRDDSRRNTRLVYRQIVVSIDLA